MPAGDSDVACPAEQLDAPVRERREVVDARPAVGVGDAVRARRGEVALDCRAHADVQGAGLAGRHLSPRFVPHAHLDATERSQVGAVTLVAEADEADL
ncbi:hypothetical protein ACFPRL_11955 [Pseudoclavibacter helvolus]